MRKIPLVILCMICISVSTLAQNMTSPETRGVWITGNFLQGGTAAIETVMKNMQSANLNVAYVNVWYEGSTIYPSDVVPQAGGPSQNSVFKGSDPLQETIDIAHKYGIQVIAWFEYGFSVGVNTDSTKIPNILKLHPDWSMVESDTTKKFDYDSGNYFFWVDPAVSGAADFIVNLYQECAKKHPDIDGIELDRTRYPTTNYSYSDTARARFMKETGNRDPLFLSNDNSAWTVWRRQQVTNVVKRIYQAIKSVNSTCVVTGAVVPPYMMYGGDQDKMQGWDVWAKNSYVDMLEPMLYLTTGDFPYQMTKSLSYVPAGFNLAAGIAISSAGSVDNAIYEIKKARTSGSTGQVIWYYGDYLSYSNAISSLKSNVYPSAAAPAYDDLIMDDASKGLFSSKGSWSVLQGGYNGTYRAATASAGDTAIYKVRILRDGSYNIFGYWTGDSASNTKQAILDISTKTVHMVDTVNQKIGLNQWNNLNKFNINSGDTVVIKLFGADGASLIADAFRVKRGGVFQLDDSAVPDSQSVILKFSKQLMNPPSNATTITSSLSAGNLKFTVDQSDNTVMHVVIPTVAKGGTFTLSISNLMDVFEDTLSTSISLTYEPDKTSFLIDDQTSNMFWKLTGTWTSDTSYTAYGGSYQTTKQNGSPARVQWGPQKIAVDGYYDVSVRIPKTSRPLAEKCMYIMRDHYKVDTIYISQSAAAGTIYKLGSFPFVTNDNFALLLSAISNADTSKYLAADEVILQRSVEMTVVKDKAAYVSDFIVSQNYPNPFNPSTTLSFELKSKATVFIDVYNIIGAKVASLISGKEYNAGKWNVKFDAVALPSGVYFAQTRIKSTSSETKKTIKMMLMK